MGRIKCLLIAIKDFLEHGMWIRHLWIDTEYEKAIIITTPDSFRVSRNYEHKPGEEVHKDAVLITSKCKYCGKVQHYWCTKEFYYRHLKGEGDNYG